MNVDPRKGEILDPDMNLICLWCGKDYNPYNNIVIHDYAFSGFCSLRCFSRYRSIPGRAWRVIKWPFWKLHSMIVIWNDARYALPCPRCGEMMVTMTRDLQYCDNLDCDIWGIVLEVTSYKDHQMKVLFEEDEIYAKEKGEGSEGEGEEGTSA